MAENAGRLAVVKVSGAPVAFADEATTANGDRTRYQITDAAKQVWDRTAAITVKRDGNAVAASEYTLERLSGTVVFAVAQNVGAVITVSGQYLPLTAIASAHEYTYRREANLMPTPKFGQSWLSRLTGIKFGGGTLSKWDVIDTFFVDALTAGEVVVLEFRADAAAAPRRVYALLEQDEMTAAIDNPQDEVVTFVSTDAML